MYKNFLWYKRRDSLTNVLLTLGLPSFDTMLNNAYASFWRLWKRCNSLVVAHFRTLNRMCKLYSFFVIFLCVYVFFILLFYLVCSVHCFYGPCCLIQIND